MSSPGTLDFDEIDHLMRGHAWEALANALDGVSSWEILDCMRRLPMQRQALVYRLLGKEVALEVFEQLAAPLQTNLLRGLRDEDLTSLIEDLDPDDRVALFDELPAKVVDRLLQGLSPQEQRVTAPMLGYPTGSIGRRMSPEYVRLHPTMTVGEALARVRMVGSDAETIQILPVTDDVRHLLGTVTLADLVLAPETVTISTIRKDTVSRRAETMSEEAARACADHRLLGLPITDREERLVGIVTVDDALKIISEAEDEDTARAGAAEPLRQPYLSTPILRIVRARTGWLLVLAFSAMLTVSVLEQFEATLAEAVVLALFIPLLTGIGGNTGSQAASTLTRALAVADVRPRDIGKVAFREIRVGFTMGLLLAALGFGIATPIYGADIGLVVSSTLLIVCTMAATVGGVMPLAAKSLRVDPAAFSTPFISTFCDATGLLIYFAIAKLVLGL